MKDFLIVGCGLAGISFAETAFQNSKSFTVISDNSQNSSIVAAGIYNPVIVKRFSMPADSAAHLEYCKPFYAAIEKRLGAKFDHPLPLYRKFASVEEQNDWFAAADKPALAQFLSTAIVHKKYPHLPSPFGFGELLHTGYVDTAVLLQEYRNFLNQNDWLLNDPFDYAQLVIENDHVIYKDCKARHIIFAEGFGIHSNPYFNHLPLEGTKGELLLISAPELDLDVVVNAGLFILPVGNGHYKVGATYEWYDKTPVPTEEGKNELIEKLEEIITCNYEVTAHYAGVRPTTKDRKALIGTHAAYKNIHLLNGLGTRGVMLGPPMARQLYEAIEYGTEIDRSVDLKRFKV